MAGTPEVRDVTTGLQFPEGPVALADGSTLVVEIRRGTLSRVGADGVVTVVADLGGGPNGAAIGPDGEPRKVEVGTQKPSIHVKTPNGPAIRSGGVPPS